MTHAPALALARELPGVRGAPMPDFIAPALATPRSRPPTGEGWIHEIKFDGYRAQLHKSNAGTRTITLKTVRFPAPDVAIADGEYVIGASQTAAARNMWTSFVMVRDQGRWRISAIRNMLPASPAS